MSSESNCFRCWTENNNSILPWKTFGMVGIDIKSFVKHLKLSVQVKEKFLGSLTYGTSGGEYQYCDPKRLV